MQSLIYSFGKTEGKKEEELALMQQVSAICELQMPVFAN